MMLKIPPSAKDLQDMVFFSDIRRETGGCLIVSADNASMSQTVTDKFIDKWF